MQVSNTNDCELRIFDCPALIELSCGLAGAIGLSFLPVLEGGDWQAECQQLLENVPASRLFDELFERNLRPFRGELRLHPLVVGDVLHDERDE